MKLIKYTLQIRIVCLIAFITIVNYFDRSAISFAILPIESELGINNAQFGLLASGFGMGYLVMAFFGGIVVDRFNASKVWALAAVLWSLTIMAMSLSKGFISLFILRILLGFTEGVHFPALLKITTDWLVPNFRARSIAIGLLGVPLATLLGSPFITYLIESMGWRKMFVVLGLLGILWVILWLLSLRGEKNPHLGTAHLRSFPKHTPWKEIFTSRTYLVHNFIYFVFGYVVFFVLMWLPGYFEQAYHFSIHKTGFLVMAPWFASAIFLVAGGWISDFIFNKTRSIQKGRTYPIAIAMLFSAICFALLLYSDSVGFNLAMMSLGLAFAFFINSSIYAANADLFPAHTGVAQGIFSCFFALAGIVSPLITGWLVQTTGSYHSPILLVALLCAASSFAALFCKKTSRVRMG